MTDIIEAEFRPLAVQDHRPPAAPQLLDALRPAERVALMAEVSGVVKDVIEKQKWFTQIHDKKHIRIEGWTFIGGLGACSAKTTHVEQIDGGWKAHAVVVRVDSGIEVGSAEQVCMRTEPFGKGKADQALIGMASTRACSRALSTVFRHVVELAGYSAAPAEEMSRDDKPLGKPAVPPDEPLRPVAEIIVDLKAQAVSLGIRNFTEWAATQIDPSIATEKKLTRTQATQAQKLLDELTKMAAASATAAPPPSKPAPEASTLPAPASVASKGLLFARLAEHGYKSQIQRHAFAKNAGVALPTDGEGNPTYAGISAAAVTRLLDALDTPAGEPAQ